MALLSFIHSCLGTWLHAGDPEPHIQENTSEGRIKTRTKHNNFIRIHCGTRKIYKGNLTADRNLQDGKRVSYIFPFFCF